jgi:hypothetical protein
LTSIALAAQRRTMEHRDVIAALGGYRLVAKRLGVHFTSTCRWQSSGIPPKAWVAVVRLARARHLKGITCETLSDTSPSPTYRGTGVVLDKQPEHADVEPVA